MSSTAFLVYYCVLILLSSVVGGMIPEWWKLTHRWMEVAVSFVAGIIFGVAVLHMLPHALVSALEQSGSDMTTTITGLMVWFVIGFLAMFFIERFFCFHHHEAPADEEHVYDEDHVHGPGCSHEPHSDHAHDITWTGAAIGLTLHSLLAGVALAASVAHGHGGGTLPGLGTFLVIFLHKPFDAMTIAMLMARSGYSLSARSIVNALFSLAIPAGAGLFLLGLSPEVGPVWFALPAALAFSAGVFLCIAGSDLLPELQFHHHDRWKLSAALLLGLAVAYVAGRMEGHTHTHQKDANTPASAES
ncbi:ZIP family metal transporter [Aeoliella sp.]|uniref:ZIP family metal transporter n=1 Tax=Aeoliella sp. TaxID=2795800 RepID=UPI003CCC058A